MTLKYERKKILAIVTFWKNIDRLIIKAAMFIFVLLTNFVLNKGYCQVNYIPESPLATQFEKYINYPVDHSTGAASIEVPLYNLKAGSIKIPINISYHTAGVKPSDPSLPVGLGWVINPGGRVTRKVLSYPDEKLPKPAYQESISPTDDLQYFQKSEYNPPSSNFFVSASFDTDYDIFTYQTGTGTTGRFLIQKENSEYIAVPLIETNDRIKVHVVSSGGTSHIDYIEVTDATGTYYRFGKGLNNYSNSSTSSKTEISSGSAITGWMLTDIISADQKDTVSLIWKNVRNSVSNYYKQVDYLDNAILTDQWDAGNINPLDFPALGYKESIQFSGQLSESYYLTNVVAGLRYKNEEVKLIYTNDFPTLLTRMEVHLSGTKFRQVDFHKSHFANGVTKLDSVSFLDKNSQRISRYHFGYNSLTWPSPPTRQIDYWGYYNGANNATLVPNFSLAVNYRFGTFTASHSQTNRNPLEGRTQASILNSITYPTGGKTTYEYEQNKIYDVGLDQILPVGGVRVKSISHWSAEGNLAEKRTFVYGIGESGAGDGLPMETNMFINTTKECQIVPYGWGCTYSTYRKRVLTGSPLGSLFTFDFPSVTYRSVTEYIVDKNGNNSGKIVYNYSRVQYPLRSLAPSYDQYAYMGRYWDRARLLETIYYQNDQGIYKRVRANTISYRLFETDTIQSWTFKRFAYFSNPLNMSCSVNDPMFLETNFAQYYPSLPSVFSFGSVYLYSGSVVPHNVRSVEYDRVTGDSVVVEKTYSYPNGEYLYPSSLTQTNSNNKSSVTHFTYPKDYSVGTNPTNNVARGIKLLKDRNVMAPVIEEYTEVQPGNFVKSGKFITYKTNQPKPESTFILKTISPPESFNSTTITSSSHSKSPFYILDNQVVDYSSSGNPLEVSKSDGITYSFIWGYNDRYPIAQTTNAAEYEIAYTSFESADSKGNWNYLYADDIPEGCQSTCENNCTTYAQNYCSNICASSCNGDPNCINSCMSGCVPGTYGSCMNDCMNGCSSSITINTGDGKTGNHSFKGSGASVGGLPTGYYKVSYWVRKIGSSSGAVTINGTSTTISGSGWQYKEFVTPNVVSSLSVTLSGVYLDELRLFPTDAQMTTYTYDPLIGMTSQTDAAGQTTTFEYDDFGRLETVRGADGNVLQHYDYNYKD